MPQLSSGTRKSASRPHPRHTPGQWAYARLLVLLSLGLIGIALLGTSASLLSAAAAGTAQPSGQRLRALAGNFLIGYASVNNFWSLSDASTYEATASSEFNILTPENQLKWETIHPQQTTYNFAPGDQHVQFAEANGMAVHGHNLVWYQSNPSWLDNGTWTASTLTAVLYDHIDTVVGHYRGKIALWDVVNEAYNDDGSLRSSVWLNNIGRSYIELAFDRAHAADPNAILVYNDYGIETVNSKSNAVYAMAQDFVARGVPLRGIGLQMHVDESGVDLTSLSSNMQRFASLGLNVYITEMDVRLPASPSATDLNNQATVYQNVLDRCLLQPACKGLQMWGFTDKYSWVPGFFPGMGAALIFDANYVAKPAYFALQSRLGGAGQPSSTPTPTQTSTPTPTATPAATLTATPTSGASINAYATIQAESFSAKTGGPQTETTSDAGGGLDVGYIVNNDWLRYDNVNFGSTGATQFTARIASGAAITGQIDVHLDSVSNPSIGTLVVGNTGGWQSWQTATTNVTATTGTHTVFLTFSTGSSGYLANINWFDFGQTAGATPTPTPATIQAESFSAKTAGPQTETTSDTGGGLDVGYIVNNDWLRYDNVNFGSTGATQFTARIASGAGITGQIDVHLDSVSNQSIGTLVVGNTGGWQSWQTATTNINATTGTHTVFLTFSTGSSGYLVNINWFDFGQAASFTPTSTPSPTASVPPTATSTPLPPTALPASINAYATIQAESFGAKTTGPQTEATSDMGGGLDVGYIVNNDWLRYDNINFGSTSATQFIARIASGAGITGQIDVHLDSVTNPSIGTLVVGNTGGWQSWQTATANVSAATGTHTVFLTFSTGSSGYLVNINWFDFRQIASVTPTPTAVTIQAASFGAKTAGPQTETTSDTGGGLDVGYIVNNDWLRYDNVNFGSMSATQFVARIASGAGITGQIDVHLDSVTNPSIGTLVVGNTGGWQSWQTATANVSAATGTHTVFLTFSTGSSGYLININWFQFQ